ncbi:unnamed protein product [Nesidiocoris tenuis]|uniref:RRM domain-containing protein n=1 Tax=Nesidiocoris tenuis TaxID=355587 RepID=A0A6H5H5Z1_9HEMI|nr:unnamed protein product [Nesidiocoris tenuis]
MDHIEAETVVLKRFRRNGFRDNNPEGEQFRKLFIGGLDYRTTDQSLKQFYEQWGEIVDVVVMKHPQTQKALQRDNINYFPSQASGAANNVNVKKMFVGGLKEQTEEELKDYFGQYGTIIGVNVVMDKTTGKRKGYAFIEYNDYDPVDKALLVKEHSVAGKSVTVKKAVVKDGTGGPPGRGGRGGGRGGGRAGAGGWGGNGGGWGGANGYGAGGGGPWDGSQGNGWGNGSWDQYGDYGGGWNGAAAGGGYGQQGGYGGGPVRSNYNSGGQRNAPYAPWCRRSTF